MPRLLKVTILSSSSRVLFFSMALLSSSMLLPYPPALSDDVMAPHVNRTKEHYSDDQANEELYGTGIGAIHNECSDLRFQIERALQVQQVDKAVKTARRATELDAKDPQNHLWLARSLTSKLKTGRLNMYDVKECMQEWQMLKRHDADPENQAEAARELRQLHMLALHLRLRDKKGVHAQLAQTGNSTEE